MNRNMKRIIRTIIVMAITLIVIIAIFWFILPQTGLADEIGSAYYVVALVGSLVISYFVSMGVNKILSLKK